tara:strand:- start:6045 stop:7253 length:1209 start_codon:yes stop_codon:yes gene_type:complete
MNSRILALCVSLLTLPVPLLARAEGLSLEPLSEAVRAGEGRFAVRYRYEHVDQDGIDRDANASTARARYTWRSADVDAWSFGFEADYVAMIGPERYNSTANGETGYPVVADPEGFDLNQAFVAYRNDALTLTGGRQRILHGNQRFVGGVGWRQNEQTFDAVRLESRVGAVALDYAYVANVNRIFGPDDGVQPADWRSDSHLLRLDWPLSEGIRLGAFGYLMDFDNDNGPPNANATAGLEAQAQVGPVKLEATIARQTDYADNPQDYQAWYGRVEAAANIRRMTVTAGVEVLGSDAGTAAFRTPLATLHKFQGWADKFLNTPAAGIEDVYFGLAGRWDRLTASVVYHELDSEQGDVDYGSEVDVALGYSLSPRVSAQLKASDYDSDGFATDTRKLWLTVNVSL